MPGQGEGTLWKADPPQHKSHLLIHTSQISLSIVTCIVQMGKLRH